MDFWDLTCSRQVLRKYGREKGGIHRDCSMCFLQDPTMCRSGPDVGRHIWGEINVTVFPPKPRPLAERVNFG